MGRPKAVRSEELGVSRGKSVRVEDKNQKKIKGGLASSPKIGKEGNKGKDQRGDEL